MLAGKPQSLLSFTTRQGSFGGTMVEGTLLGQAKKRGDRSAQPQPSVRNAGCPGHLTPPALSAGLGRGEAGSALGLQRASSPAPPQGTPSHLARPLSLAGSGANSTPRPDAGIPTPELRVYFPLPPSRPWLSGSTKGQPLWLWSPRPLCEGQWFRCCYFL